MTTERWHIRVHHDFACVVCLLALCTAGRCEPSDEALSLLRSTRHIDSAQVARLAELVPDLPGFVAKLTESDDLNLKYKAIYTLGELGEKAKPHMQVLDAQLASKDDSARWLAALALSKVAPESPSVWIAPLLAASPEYRH